MRAREVVSIPVIVNGDVRSADDAQAIRSWVQRRQARRALMVGGGVLGVEAAELFRAARQPGARFEMGLGAIDADPDDGLQSVVVRRLGDLRLHVRIRFRFAGRADPVWRTYPASEPHPWLRFQFADQPGDEPFGPLEEVWIDPPVGSHAAGGEPFEADVGPCGVWVIERDLTDNAWRATPDPRPAALRAIRVLEQLQIRFSFAGAIG